MRYHQIEKCSVENGLGVRTTIYLSGCVHRCKNCHNPETWDFNGGNEFKEETKEELFSYLALPYINGITFSGGDPLCSYDEVLELTKEIKERFPDKTIWVYTGYTLEELIKGQKEAILEYIDVLVDGRYVDELRDVTLPFRGSSNQRILEKGKDF
jgi:anaerobic ribonucleoside-triphosphate reductase activating protein